MLDLSPDRVPNAPRDAATVVVVRDGPGLVEVFCVKRHGKSGFLGGAVVFPGGTVDADDQDPAWAACCTALSERAGQLAETEGRSLGFAVAALRELFEEAALLPTSARALDHDAVLRLRQQLPEQPKPDEGRQLRELLGAHGLTLDTGRLVALGRWVTPTAESRRYDTRFYLLPLTEAQHGRHDAHETTEGYWATPAEVLERWRLGELFLAPPTSHTLELLATAKNADAALAVAGRQSLQPVFPHFVLDADLTVLALPGDPLYPDADRNASMPEGPTRFVLRDGRFVPERA